MLGDIFSLDSGDALADFFIAEFEELCHVVWEDVIAGHVSFLEYFRSVAGDDPVDQASGIVMEYSLYFLFSKAQAIAGVLEGLDIFIH